MQRPALAAEDLDNLRDTRGSSDMTEMFGLSEVRGSDSWLGRFDVLLELQIVEDTVVTYTGSVRLRCLCRVDLPPHQPHKKKSYYSYRRYSSSAILAVPILAVPLLAVTVLAVPVYLKSCRYFLNQSI